MTNDMSWHQFSSPLSVVGVEMRDGSLAAILQHGESSSLAPGQRFYMLEQPTTTTFQLLSLQQTAAVGSQLNQTRACPLATEAAAQQDAQHAAVAVCNGDAELALALQLQEEEAATTALQHIHAAAGSGTAPLSSFGGAAAAAGAAAGPAAKRLCVRNESSSSAAACLPPRLCDTPIALFGVGRCVNYQPELLAMCTPLPMAVGSIKPAAACLLLMT